MMNRPAKSKKRMQRLSACLALRLPLVAFALSAGAAALLLPTAAVAAVALDHGASASASGTVAGIPTLTFDVAAGNNRIVFLTATFERDHCTTLVTSTSCTIDSAPNHNFAAPNFVTTGGASPQINFTIIGSGGASVTVNNPLAAPAGDLRFGNIANFAQPGSTFSTPLYSQEAYYTAIYESQLASLLGGAASGTLTITLPDVTTPHSAGDEAMLAAIQFNNVSQISSGTAGTGIVRSLVSSAGTIANCNTGSGYTPGRTAPGNWSVCPGVLAYDAGQAPGSANDGVLLFGLNGYSRATPNGFQTVAGFTPIANASGSVVNTDPAGANYVTAPSATESDGFSESFQFANGVPAPSSIKMQSQNGALGSGALTSGGLMAGFTVTGATTLDLAITKDDGVASVVSGASTTYTIVATNNSTQSYANGAVVTDPAATNLTKTAVTCAGSGGAVCPAGLTVAALEAGASVPVFPPGGSLTFTVTATVAAGATGTVVNTATVAVPAGYTDTNTANNSAQDTDAVINPANISIVKSGPATLASGATISYSLLIGNAGPGAADGATYNDAVPAGITNVSAVCATTSGGATCAAPSVAGNTVSGSVTAFPANSSVTVTITGTAPVGAQTLTNAATVTPPSGVPDPDPSDNTSSVDTTIGGAADIAVAKIVDNATPNVGDQVSFTITATNNGPNDATGVALTDSLPAGLSFVSATPSQGSYDSATGVWTIGALANGDSAMLTMVVSVDEPGSLTNAVAVSASDQPDPNTSNNNAGASVNAGASADIAVLKTASQSTPNVGSQITYTITATNNGPNDATGIEITDNLPAGTTFVGAVPQQGTFDSSSGVWVVGALADGASTSLAITVTVDVAGPLTNAATITHEDQFDPVGANNQTGTTINGQQADLAVTKTVDNATPNVGDTVTFTIGVHNNGPSDATNVALGDLLPASLSFVSASPSQGSYDDVTGIWTVGTLTAVGATSSATLTVVATVQAAGPTTNTASVVASDQPDPNTANNSDSASLNGNPLADLVVGKSGPATVTPGNDIVYTIVVTNDGPSDAVNVVVADPSPAGLTFVGNAGACTSAYPCAIGTLASGASVTITTTYNVPANYGGADPIVNTASASSDTPDPDTTNNQASVQTTVGPGDADLAIDKQGPAVVASNGAITYTLLIVNNGPSPANGASYSDAVPSGITAIGATCGGELGGAACMSQPAVAGNTVSGTIGTLPSGGSAVITITGTAPQGPLTLSNTAGVQPPNGVTDPNLGNNQDSVDTDVGGPMADLEVDKTGPAQAVPGMNATYTLTVTNHGPDTALAVQLDDPTPSGMSFVSASAPCQGGFPCALGDLSSGASVVVSVTFAIAPGAAGSIDNTATVTSPTGDPDPSDNIDTVTTPLAPQADLVALKSGPATVGTNGAISYTVVVSNRGPSDVDGALFDDPVPAGISAVTASCGAPSGGAVCGAVSVVGNTVSSTIATLPSGGTVTFTINGIAPASAAMLTNTAGVEPPAGVTDPDPSNNTSTVDTTVAVNVANADLAAVKTGPATVGTNGAISYTVVVTNNGPAAADGATFSDSVPAAITGVTASCGTPTNGAGCGPVLVAGNVVTSTIAILPSGGSVTFTIAGIAPASATTLTNTAGVQPPAGVADPDPSDNSSSVDTNVVPTTAAADLVVIKTGPASANTGDTISYTIQVANNGPDAVPDAVLTDPTPPGLTYVSSTAPCAGGFPCALGALANGARVTFTATYIVQAGYTGRVVNTASANSSTVPDPSPNNNSSTATTPIGGGNPGGEVAQVPVDARWMLVLMSVLLMLAGSPFAMRRR